MTKEELKPIVEAILFSAETPLTVAQIKKLLKVSLEPTVPESAPADSGEKGVSSPQESLSEPVSEPQPVVEASSGEEVLDQLKAMQKNLEGEISIQEIKAVVQELVETYRSNTGFELANIAGGYQFRTKVDFAPYVRGLVKLPKPRLSSPAMETLAVIAYQQPVNRNKVDEIRGVDSGGVVKTLLDRDLIRIVGRSEEPGRPILYGTTSTFLEVFSLSSLSELPTLKDLDLLELSNNTLTNSTQSPDLNDEITESIPDEMQESSERYFDTDEESDLLINDLENSLHAIKDLEKKIFPPKEKSEES